MSKKVLFIISAIVLLLIAVFALGKGMLGDGDTIEVAMETIEKRDIIEMVGTNGKIYPEKQVRLSVEVAGEITKIHVEEGDSVQEGDLLLEINPSTSLTAVSRSSATYKQSQANLSSTQARYAQTEAQFLVAESDYNRKKTLYEQGVISALEFEQAESQYFTASGEKKAAFQNIEAAKYQTQSAQATLNESQEFLSKTKLYAPMSGIISALNVEQGEKVVGTAQMAGTELITIADLGHMELQVEVGENDVLRISIGDTAEVEVDAYLGEKFLGIVSHIAYSSDNDILGDQVTKFQVKIKLIASSYAHLVNAEAGHAYPFRPGMSATADIITNEKKGIITVPIQSVTLRENEENNKTEQVVFLVENGLAKKHVVKTGIQDDTYIEIIDGIATGDVIAAPFSAISKTLVNDISVTVVEEEDLFVD